MTRRATIALLLALALPRQVASQIATDSGGRSELQLSLDEAIAIAERRNPAYRATLNDRDVAASARREAIGGYLPRLSAGITSGGNSFRRRTTFDEFGNSVSLDVPVTSRTSSTSHYVDLQLTLFDGGAREAAVSAAGLELRAATARAEVQRVTLGAEVARRYFGALGALRRIALEERLVVSARDQLEATQRLFRVATARRSDVLGSEAEVAGRESGLERARGEAQKALLALRETLGLDDSVTVSLTDSLPLTLDSLVLDPDVLTWRAKTNSPALIELEAAVSAAERRASQARGARWPHLTASASFSRSFYDRNYEAMWRFDPPDQSFSFRVGTAVPFFDGFRASASVTRASAAAADAREELRAQRLALEREVRSVTIDVQNALRRRDLAFRGVALGRERVELAREEYRVGAIRLIELQLVLDRVAAAEREEIDARVALANAVATLEERVGGPLTP